MTSFASTSWAEFLKSWKTLNRGFTLNSSVPKDLPTTNKHVFVVLGSGLKPNGGMPAKFLRRLKVTVKALKAYPDSKVIVSGGKAKNGKTEASVGKAYLLAAGIPASRVITEAKSASTVGNARYSMALIRSKGFTTYTLISDASHLRRAGVLFEAAKMQLEQKYGKTLNAAPVKNVTYIDSRSAEKPPSSSEHSVIAYHTSLLLGVAKSYLLDKYKGTAAGTVSILRRGSTGAEVKALQKALGITADGIYGPDTEAAVKKYQQAHSLVADGIAGPTTRKSLKV